MNEKGFKTEMHLHTAGGSRCARVEPEEIVRIYGECGYDALTVTNHWNRKIAFDYFSGSKSEKTEKYLAGYRAVKELAKDMRVFFGMELALGNDYYSPTNFRACELLIYGIVPEEFYDCAFDLIEFDYAALKKFASERGWLIYQAHPYRERSKRVKSAYLDGLEIYNNNMRHFNRNAKAKARAEKYSLLEVGGSDFHQPEDVGAGVVFDAEIFNERELVRALKNGAYKIINEKS